MRKLDINKIEKITAGSIGTICFLSMPATISGFGFGGLVGSFIGNTGLSVFKYCLNN